MNTTNSKPSFFKSLAAAALVTTGLLSGPVHASAEHAIASPIASPFAALFDAPQLEGTLNINQASAAQWELLPGIGPVTAERIVDYRSTHPFKDPLHLMRVKGIGRKTFNKIKPFLRLDGPTTLRVAK